MSVLRQRRLGAAKQRYLELFENCSRHFLSACYLVSIEVLEEGDPLGLKTGFGANLINVPGCPTAPSF